MPARPGFALAGPPPALLALALARPARAVAPWFAGWMMTTTLQTSIPGPIGHPVVGMGWEFRRDMLGTLLAGFKEYGDVIAYPFGPRWGPLRRVSVAAHHPDQVHQVLTNTGPVFGRRTPGFGVLTEVLGRGLLTTEGEEWRRQRRTLQPLFTPRRVTGYTELMAAEAARVVGDRADGAVVDLYDLMQRYTLRVVGRALFGEDIDSVVADLQRLMPRLSDLAMARTMQAARLPLSVPTPRNLRLVRLRRVEYGLVDRILAAAGVDGDDLVSRLRAARDPDTGQPLSTQEVRDQVLVFLLAGHETTAGALTFTLHLLGRRPEIQERAAGETAVARAAVMEGMRLYPPAYGLERVALTGIEIGGYELPRGTFVILAPWVTHRHPQFWPEPERFRPERFLGEVDRHRYAYFPFGGGPRSCIGEHFAMLEATILLQAMLARYRVEALGEAPRLAPMVTLRPAGRVEARLTAH
jgi:cytochrome P450